MKKEQKIFYKCLNCGQTYTTTHMDIFDNITVCRKCGKKFVITYDKKMNRPWWQVDWEELSKDKEQNQTYKRSIILFFICVIIYLILFYQYES